jgi:hypothetical protein
VDLALVTQELFIPLIVKNASQRMRSRMR